MCYQCSRIPPSSSKLQQMDERFIERPRKCFPFQDPSRGDPSFSLADFSDVEGTHDFVYTVCFNPRVPRIFISENIVSQGRLIENVGWCAMRFLSCARNGFLFLKVDFVTWRLNSVKSLYGSTAA